MTDHADFAQLDRLALSVLSPNGSLEDVAAEFLRKAILYGHYLPGQRLPQDRIADTLGMSRMPVRTALRRLETEGLIVFHPYRGAMVRMLQPAEVAEIYALRSLVESELMRLAGERLTAANLLELRTRADNLSAETDAIAWLQLRHTLYDYLYSIAERPLMSELVRDLRQRVGPYLILRNIAESQRQARHQTMVEHLENQDIAGAITALRSHLASISEELQSLVSRPTSRTWVAASGAKEAGVVGE
jgi:DNA-binding GntR family transcriptional regulator